MAKLPEPQPVDWKEARRTTAAIIISPLLIGYPLVVIETIDNNDLPGNDREHTGGKRDSK